MEKFFKHYSITIVMITNNPPFIRSLFIRSLFTRSLFTRSLFTRSLFTAALLLLVSLGAVPLLAQDADFSLPTVQAPKGISVGAKNARLKKMDLFNSRSFQPFFFVEGNVGLVSTFSKDKVFTVSPPLSVGAGYRFSSKFSLGLNVGQSVYNAEMYYYDRAFKSKAQTRLQVASLLANIHLPLGEQAEVFGGFGAAYQHTTVTALEENPNKSGDGPDERTIVRPQQGLYATAVLGGRLSLAPNVAVQASISNGLSTFSAGLRYRLR